MQVFAHFSIPICMSLEVPTAQNQQHPDCQSAQALTEHTLWEQDAVWRRKTQKQASACHHGEAEALQAGLGWQDRPQAPAEPLSQ